MKRSLSVLSIAVVMAASGVASAQPPPKNGNHGDAAAATALFYEARTLMRKGNYAAACPKLEESLRLDYGIGTQFNLADCNEHIGKLATAWSGYLDVAAASKAANQRQREKVARERASAVEPRVPKLVIEVPSPPLGVDVRRDGVRVGAAAWGTPVPVDPGAHRIVVSAPGKERWETTVQAPEATTVRVTVPRSLPNAAVAVAPPPPPAPASTTPTPTPSPVTTTTTPPPAELPPAVAEFPPPVVEHGSTQRTIGWVVGAAGVAGLGLGAGFGLSSLAKHKDSDAHCAGDRCDATGVKLRQDAITAGDISTVATVAGGAALIGGILLVLTAPSGTEQRANAASATSFDKIRAVPRVGVNGGGLTVEGVLP